MDRYEQWADTSKCCKLITRRFWRRTRQSFPFRDEPR